MCGYRFSVHTTEGVKVVADALMALRQAGNGNAKTIAARKRK
jgi:hypothetical protein